MTVQRSPFFTQDLPSPRSRLFSRVTTTSPTPATCAVGERDTVRQDFAGVDPVLPRPPVEFGDGGGVGGDHEARLARGHVGFPRLVQPLEHLRPCAARDPAMGLVCSDSLFLPHAQSGAGHLLPLVAEPPHLGELRGELGPVADQEPERPAGVDGGKLRPVPGQQHLGPRPFGRAHQLVQAERPGQAGLVDDH